MERFRGGAIGMDVDRGAIKAVQISKTASGFALHHVGYHKLPEGAIVEGEVADSEMLAAEIRTFWDLHSFRGKSVVLGVAGRNVIVRFVDFPRLSAEDLDSALSFQAEEHIPMPLEDTVLDHIVLGPSPENPEEDRVLVVAAHRAMISGYTNAVRSGGLKPAGIDVKALSLMRSTLPDALFDNEETVLLLDVGTEISNLVVVQNRRPTLTQFIPLGFRDFSQAVAEAADIEAEEAEKQAVNPMANIGSFMDEGRIEPASEAETIALDPYTPENEEEASGKEGASDDSEPTIEEDATSEEDATREINPFTAPESDDDGSGNGEREESGAFSEFGEGEGTRGTRPGDGVDPAFSEDAEGESGTDGVSREGGDETGDTVEDDGVADSGAADEARTEEISSDPALMYDVRRGLEDAAGRLAEEVQRSVEFHNSRPDAREISRVLISGEGALVRGLDSYLGDLLGVEAGRARPSEKLTENRSNISDEQLGAMEPVLAIALGLAMEDES